MGQVFFDQRNGLGLILVLSLGRVLHSTQHATSSRRRAQADSSYTPLAVQSLLTDCLGPED